MLGNLGFGLKLMSWFKQFLAILKGEVAPPKVALTAMDVQLALIRKGYLVRISGKLDEQTREALRKLQSEAGLEVDGKFGPQTQKALGL